MARDDRPGDERRDRERATGSPGEFEMIRRLTAALTPGRGVIIGPGDDAAVVRPATGMDLVITTDTFIEDRHFRRIWFDLLWHPSDLESQPNRAPDLESRRGFAPEIIGARLAAANLSDIAAMAAIPRWAVLSLGASGSDPGWLERVERGVSDALGREGAAIVGGNLSRVEGPEWYGLTLIGEVERGRAWTRAGARPGDLVAITGSPGCAGAFVRFADSWGLAPNAPILDPADSAFAPWLRPASRVAAARALAGAGGVTAAIDLSDGFSGDLSHLCEASGVGAEIDESAWPHDVVLDRLARMLLTKRTLDREPRPPASWSELFQRYEPPDGEPKQVIDDLRFGPSDDYELLLAVDPAKREECARAARETGTPLAFVGHFTALPATLTLRRADGRTGPLPGRGYDHFGGCA